MSPPHFARLSFTGPCLSAWCSKPRSQDPHPWLRVRLGNPQYILFVATQSSDSEQNKYFALSYFLSFVDENDRKWKNYTEKGNLKVFEGNWDGSTVVKNAILNPFKTQTLTFNIVHWKSEECCLRVEIYGPGT
ncbi:phosphatidylethanolamine binding [Desmophyllum pertusum]|uniref:Phosphatidylethanolamine binding n=1 Tax=Desmophyllum pertusum TaxID=174260 RepID=A0A9X0D6X3_9CNID|nr:phosphatidylethanolamine binding [Desmophyllum pertusum]